MRRLTSIVAVNEDGAIGAANALPWRVRSDLRFFREQTEGHVVIMGRKTYDSLGRPLPRRKNIVVTHGFSLFANSQDCRAAHSIEEALCMADTWRNAPQEVFVVGGSSMYVQFAPYVDRYLITEIAKHVPDADAFLDAGIFGPSKHWNVKLLRSGKADADHDEADYKMFELNAQESTVVADRRHAVTSAIHKKRSMNRLEICSKPLESRFAC